MGVPHAPIPAHFLCGVSLYVGLGIMGFLDDVKAAAEKGKPSKTVEVALNGKVYELKFYRADGDAWAECVARHPARLDSQIDVRFGYNFNAVVLDIGLPTGRYLEDGEEHAFPLDPVEAGKEKEPPRSSAWESFLHSLSGHEVGKIADSVWALNEWDPIQEIERAKKASASRGSRRKSA